MKPGWPVLLVMRALEPDSGKALTGKVGPLISEPSSDSNVQTNFDYRKLKNTAER